MTACSTTTAGLAALGGNVPFRLLAGLLMLASLPGCRPATMGDPPPQAAGPAERPETSQPVSRRTPPPPRRPATNAAARPSLEGYGEFGEMSPAAAADVVWAALDESLAFSPVLAVWLFDSSASAQNLVSHVTARLKQHYVQWQQEAGAGSGGGAGAELRTAILAFGSEPAYLLEPASVETVEVLAALDATRVDSSGRETTFAALRAALERYLPQRPPNGKLLICVVTDEAGDDWPLVDDLVPDVRRAAVPIYVIGSPAPFGRIQATTAAIEQPGDVPPVPGWIPVRHGPESRYPEMAVFQAALGEAELAVLDSGFGPFGLEWLCRASGGSFVAIRPKAVSGYVGLLADTWPSPYVRRFSREALRGYAPDLISEAEYRQLLAANAAARVLHEAARLDPLETLAAPQLEFTRQDEAQWSAALSQAQQQAALLSPKITRLYELLKEGEADRERLMSKRWQAAYDLSVGRAATAKARLDGYNAMLAKLKRGLAFQHPGSKTWVLEPAEELPVSSLQNLADRGRDYLERVVREHPQTPWATLAAQALKTPSGWKLTER